MTQQELVTRAKAGDSDAFGQLLEENRLTVTKIAEMLNYASVYAFSKAFRKHYGLSPRAYENRKKGKTGD